MEKKTKKNKATEIARLICSLADEFSLLANEDNANAAKVSFKFLDTLNDNAEIELDKDKIPDIAFKTYEHALEFFSKVRFWTTMNLKLNYRGNIIERIYMTSYMKPDGNSAEFVFYVRML